MRSDLIISFATFLNEKFQVSREKKRREKIVHNMLIIASRVAFLHAPNYPLFLSPFSHLLLSSLLYSFSILSFNFSPIPPNLPNIFLSLKTDHHLFSIRESTSEQDDDHLHRLIFYNLTHSDHFSSLRSVSVFSPFLTTRRVVPPDALGSVKVCFTKIVVFKTTTQLFPFSHTFCH